MSLAGEVALVWPATTGELLKLTAAHWAMAASMAQLTAAQQTIVADVRSLQSQLMVSTGAGNTSSSVFSLPYPSRVPSDDF